MAFRYSRQHAPGYHNLAQHDRVILLTRSDHAPELKAYKNLFYLVTPKKAWILFPKKCTSQVRHSLPLQRTNFQRMHY